MHKVSRIYVANAGYKLAWYDGLLLQFTDVETGQPTHSVYNLVNQGGKTTFLSLFFSTFDTAKDRFLQHLSNKGQRFEHYFDEGGLPGMIVVEWQVPGDLASVTKTLVTGQIVVMKKAGDTFDPDRFFFWFHAGADLTLESIPGPKLPGPGGASQELRSREQVIHWLHDMRARYPGHFDYTSGQSDWARALESEGLDIEMLRHQVDFNRKEGAMDESFLDFKSEGDFVRRFLSLAMDTRAADDVRESVAAHCRRMARKRPLESSKAQLERLQGVFSNFAAAADEYQAASTTLRGAESTLAVAYATLDARAGERTALATAHTEFAAAQDEMEKLQRAQKLAGLQDTEALQAEVLGRANADALKALGIAETEVTAAELETRLYAAAELLSAQESAHAEVTQLNQAIEQANTGVQPFREDLGRKAALLRKALWVAKHAKTAEAAEARAAAQALLDKVNAADARASALGLARTRAERESATLEQQIAAAGRRKAALVQAGLIADDELPESAHTRLTGEAQGLEKQKTGASERARTNAANALQWQEKTRALTGERAKQHALAEQLAEQVLAAEDQRERLTHDRVLTRAVGADMADPDSEVLLPALTRFLQRAHDDLSIAELTLARLEEAVLSIQETGLAGQDPDVARVVRQLADAGVPGAMPYAWYLANVLPDAAAARAVVLSDPARFLGVTVHTEAQLEAARAALAAPAPVSRPVVVSVASDRAAPTAAGHIVVGPQDDSLYCKAAAAASLEQLESRLTRARQDRNDARTLISEADRAKAELQRYQASFSAGGLTRLRQSAAEAQDGVNGLDLALKEAVDGATAEGKAAEVEQETVTKLIEQQLAREEQARKVEEYLTEFAIHLAAWHSQLEGAQQKLTENDLDTAALAIEKQDYESARRAQLDRELSCETAAKVLDTEFAGVQRADTTYDAAADLAANGRPLDVLRGEYQTALTILASVEAEKTGHLVVQRDAAQRNLEAIRLKFMPAASGLDLAAVRSRINADFAAELANASTCKREAESLLTAAAKAQGQTEQALTAFTRQRKYPTARVPGADQLSGKDLAARLAESRAAALLAEESELEAGRRAKDARHQARDAEQASKNYRDQAASLRGTLPADHPLATPDLSLFVEPSGLGDTCGRLIEALRGAETGSRSAYQKASNEYDKVRRLAADEAFASVDVELSLTLRSNSLEASILDHARIQRAVTERIAAVSSELSTMDQDFERATDQLAGLLNDAIKLLARAADGMRLPSSVPVVGGLTVLKMPTALGKLSLDERKERVRPYMDELAATGVIPETGAAMATMALQKLVNGRLGIQILKMVDSADEQYVPVDKLSHSGAERISMALLLYFVIAKLRYEQRAKIKTAQGGILMLDNPFAKATARPIWQAILGLADATGVQLILTTGIKEYETLSVFKRFLRLARTERNVTTGRTHVSVADFNFKPQTAQEAA